MGEIIKRMGLTGGPKSGKSVIIQDMRKTIEREENCDVLVIAETATEAIEAGFIPMAKPKDNDPEKWRLYEETNKAFQLAILHLQKAKEKEYEELAKACQRDVTILYDRTVSDNEGYLIKAFGEERGRAIYEEMLKAYGTTPEEELLKYDTIFFFETVARKNIFNIKNKDDKTKRLEEDDREALIVECCLEKAMAGHPNLIRIEARDNFEDKRAEALERTREQFQNDKGRCLVRKSS